MSIVGQNNGVYLIQLVDQRVLFGCILLSCVSIHLLGHSVGIMDVNICEADTPEEQLPSINRGSTFLLPLVSSFLTFVSPSHHGSSTTYRQHIDNDNDKQIIHTKH